MTAPVFTPGSLADGQVATTQTAMYTVPGSTKAFLKTITLFNDNAVEQTIILRIKRSGGTARKWRRYVLAQNESAEVIDPGSSLELSTGDAVMGETTTASVVDFSITGVLQT